MPDQPATLRLQAEQPRLDVRLHFLLHEGPHRLPGAVDSAGVMPPFIAPSGEGEGGAQQGVDHRLRNIFDLRVPLHGETQRHRLDRHLMTPSLGALVAPPA